MIIKSIIRWVLLAGVIMVMPFIIPNIIVADHAAAFIAAAVIGLINAFIKPIIKFLTLPIRILTLGLFGFVINLVLFWVSSMLVPGFEINTLSAGVLGSLVMVLALWILDRIF